MNFVFIATEAESYALMLFSRLLKNAGHQVHMVFDPKLFANDEINSGLLGRLFDIRQQNLRLIELLRPDYVGFSTYTQDYRWNVEYARMIKARLKVPIIFGGIHCVLCAEEVIKEDCIDIVCVGEGEQAILELAQRQPPPIKNLWFKNHDYPQSRPVTEVNTLPFPDKDIFYAKRPVFMKGYTIATSRGCPYSCSFCASAALNNHYMGKYLRQRDPGHVINELMWAQERYKYRTVYFTDDNLTMNTDWLREFSEDYKRYVGNKFYCTANPATITEGQIGLLARAGCQMIGFGLQSADEQLRVKVLNRRGSNERIRDSASICRRLGVRYSWDYICGIPSAQRNEEVQAISFFNQTRPHVINTFTLVHLPHCKINKVLSQETRRRLNRGELRTSMAQRGNHWFESLAAVLPLLPRWAVTVLMNSGLYRLVRLPFVIRLALKDLCRARIGRWSDIMFPLELLAVNVKANVKLKWRSR